MANNQFLQDLKGLKQFIKGTGSLKENKKTKTGKNPSIPFHSTCILNIATPHTLPPNIVVFIRISVIQKQNKLAPISQLIRVYFLKPDYTISLLPNLHQNATL